MDDKIRCQSCGMPLEGEKKEEFLGTNQDGTKNEEYCIMCFKNGAFTETKMTLTGMVNKSVQYMTLNLGMNVATARKYTTSIIPALKRWNNKKFIKV